MESGIQNPVPNRDPHEAEAARLLPDVEHCVEQPDRIGPAETCPCFYRPAIAAALRERDSEIAGLNATIEAALEGNQEHGEMNAELKALLAKAAGALEPLRRIPMSAAHWINIGLRINGEDRTYEGDFLKEAASTLAEIRKSLPEHVCTIAGGECLDKEEHGDS